MLPHHFLRVATVSPSIRLASPAHNVSVILQHLQAAEEQQVDVLLFPELVLTGYTCQDLFHQSSLLESARLALDTIVFATTNYAIGLVIVGLPLIWQGQLYNVAAVCSSGRLLGIVPKSYLPNYLEFYEARHFTSGHFSKFQMYYWRDIEVPFGNKLIFQDTTNPIATIGIELCEDLWAPIPPSSWLALQGARVILNLSASNEVVGKADYRRSLVLQQSARCLAGYVYTSSGAGESTSDLVFGGHQLIAENGQLLAESVRFSRDSCMTLADLDLGFLEHERLQNTTFSGLAAQASRDAFLRVPFQGRATGSTSVVLKRFIDPMPFVPASPQTMESRCAEIFQIQTAALAQRLEHVAPPVATIGISGGLDSTLALLVATQAIDRIGWPRERLLGLSMPGFGTTNRTRQNALELMKALGVRAQEIDIRRLAWEQWRAVGHAPFGLNVDGQDFESFLAQLPRVAEAGLQDLVFENTQARLRTSILMNLGFVIGTGDLSEAALGWSTFNADQMSMYNPNASVPKTLVQFLVQWVANTVFEGDIRNRLLDIAATEISPELLPTTASGETRQSTETTLGPYVLHDFFLYHMIRRGASPRKILWLAMQAPFDPPYSREFVRLCLKRFLTRFFQHQYKRSTYPDGPKVGSVSLSPRGDWRMPSDARADAWLAELEEPLEPTS